MRILIDAMGGDRAPLEMVRGACLAAKEYKAEFVLIGDQEKILDIGQKEKLDLTPFQIVNTASFVSMEDVPTCVTREKKDSSMAVGLKMLAAGEGDAFVSTGNTGALFLGSSLLVRKLKGVQRAAIGTILPFSCPVLLLDSGANTVVTPEYMEQFAIMGSIYMKCLYGLPNPRVGLLNNGSEACKGTPIQVETYAKLSERKDINFVGNIEGNQVAFDQCDVLVTDGFTGNILLKSVEGTGKFLLTSLKSVFTANPFSMLAAAMVKGKLKAMKNKIDPRESGGAPLLGLKKTVIKAHGSSDAYAFKNAIGQSIRCAESDLIAEMSAELEKYLASDKAEKTTDDK